MNKYYHAFTIGFNWWMVVAPTFMIAVAIWGFNIPWIGFAKGEYVVKEGSETKFKVVPGILGGITTFLFIIESYAGVIQWFDNHMDATTDGAWSVILCVPSMVMVGLFYGLFLMIIMAFCSNLKAKLLEPEVKRKNIERFKRNAQIQDQERKRLSRFEKALKENDFSFLDDEEDLF